MSKIAFEQRKRSERAFQHFAALAETERTYESAIHSLLPFLPAPAALPLFIIRAFPPTLFHFFLSSSQEVPRLACTSTTAPGRGQALDSVLQVNFPLREAGGA